MEIANKEDDRKPTFLEGVLSQLRESNLTHVEANGRLQKLIVKLKGDKSIPDEEEKEAERVFLVEKISYELGDYASANRALMELIAELETLI